MACRSLLIAVLLVVVADPALANWWIVRASDGKCVVVDIEPTANDKTDDAHMAKVLTDEARRIASNIAKLPTLLSKGG
jgi:hypothetical protein